MITKKCAKCLQDKELDFFSVSKQKYRYGRSSICKECKKIMNRELYKRKPEMFKESVRVYEEKNPEKRRAWDKLGRALKTGKLEKPSSCSVCGSGGRIEGHHWLGYEGHELDVKWLCRSCHKKEEYKV